MSIITFYFIILIIYFLIVNAETDLVKMITFEGCEEKIGYLFYITVSVSKAPAVETYVFAYILVCFMFVKTQIQILVEI